MSDLPAPPDPTPSTPGVPAGWYNDPTTGRMRWWDGGAWTEHFHPPAPPQPIYGPPGSTPTGYIQPGYVQPGYGRPSNNAATASLVLGIVGFVITPIPFFIGFFFGGIPALLAVIFGIVGLVRFGQVRVGQAMSIVGLCLGGFMLLLIPLGAGTIW